MAMDLQKAIPSHRVPLLTKALGDRQLHSCSGHLRFQKAPQEEGLLTHIRYQNKQDNRNLTEKVHSNQIKRKVVISKRALNMAM